MENLKVKKTRKKGIDGVVAQTILWIVVVILIIFVMAPVVISFMYSLKSPYEHMQSVWTLPKNPMWIYYKEAFDAIQAGLINSLIVSFSVTVGVVLFSAITAYVFTRHKFPIKEILFSLIIALMMVPGVLTLTPSFLNILNLNLDNTLWALILPGIAGGQVGAIFLFRTFFGQQPLDLFESATIDGANDLVMFAQITLPLAIPVIMIQAVGTFGMLYNDFLWPTLVIRNEAIQTLMPRLKFIAEIANATKPGVSYAMYLLSGIPLIIVSAFGLKYFINGDFAAGMKL